MSETRHYRGTMQRIAVGRDKANEVAKERLNTAGKTELPNYHDNWYDYLCDFYYKDYVFVNNALYSVEKSEVGEEDVFIAQRHKDGYKFEVAYYDGGMSFDEALQEAIDNAERE